MDAATGPNPRRGRRGPGRALTEDAIVDAAITLLDEGGPAAASVRGIATRVGVAPNAVYTYFPDKAAVVRAIVERLLGEVAAAAPADPAVPWRDGVEALALAVRRVLTAHPGAVPLMVGGPMDGPHALLLGERLLELLGRAGLSPEDAAHASYLLIVHAFGSMALEPVEDPAQPPDELVGRDVGRHRRHHRRRQRDVFGRRRRERALPRGHPVGLGWQRGGHLVEVGDLEGHRAEGVHDQQVRRVGGVLGGEAGASEELQEPLAEQQRVRPVHASYLLIVHAFGSMALEVADLDEVASPLPPEADRVAAREGTFAATPAAHFPLSAAVVTTMAAYISTDQFLWGLRRILDGIEGQAAGQMP